MARTARVLLIVLVAALAFYVRTVSAVFWPALAAVLVYRASVLRRRTHLVLSICGNVACAVGAMVLGALAWWGSDIPMFLLKWQAYAGIWFAVTLALHAIDWYLHPVEYGQVADTLSGSLRDLATSRRIPDLRGGGSGDGLGA